MNRIRLKPVVRYREFPFGIFSDPRMQDHLSSKPWTDKDRLLAYLSSGHILGLPMGADLTDWLDRSCQANPLIKGKTVGGTTPMTDGYWFWYAGLIYFIARYDLEVSPDFLKYAAEHDWTVPAKLLDGCSYDYSYFD